MSLGLREMAFDQVQKMVRGAVDDFITRSLVEQPQSPVREVAEYTVLSGGHRWRPLVASQRGLSLTLIPCLRHCPEPAVLSWPMQPA